MLEGCSHGMLLPCCPHKPKATAGGGRLELRVCLGRGAPSNRRGQQRHPRAALVVRAGGLPASRYDYGRLFSEAPSACPGLFLAPMENLGERRFRVALNSVCGGFDEATQEFLRVPNDPDLSAKAVRGLCRSYDPGELGAVPLAVQIMGGQPRAMAAVAQSLAACAPSVNINCGCPANQVTGKGAGSSLLKDPYQLHAVVAAVVAAAQREAEARGGPPTPVSVKMRSGFNDDALLVENLRAVQEAGVDWVILHPRTKQQGYRGAADWSCIALAKDTLSIPVIGNGDVTTAERALALVERTGADGVMVGRGAVQDPLIFHRIRRLFADKGRPTPGWRGGRAVAPAGEEEALVSTFLRTFHGLSLSTEDAPGIKRGRRKAGPGTKVYERRRIDKLKQLANYLFQRNPALQADINELIRRTEKDGSSFQYLEELVERLEDRWGDGPGNDAAPLNTFNCRRL